MKLKLKNPHSVSAALRERPQDVISLQLSGKGGGPWDEVVRLAKIPGIPITTKDRGEVSHATVLARAEVPVEEILQGGADRAGGRGVWLALDQLHDPHNVGAIFRSAAFFGVQGVVLPRDRNARLTDTVYDVASGGMEYVPHGLVTNLGRAIVAARDAGLWVLGSSERADTDWLEIPLDRPWLVVIGNEERGMRHGITEKCDMVCRISPSGGVGSLNAAVAAGVLISRLSAP